MKPSISIIFFTTFAGAGYGMLIWLGILSTAGAVPPDVSFGAIALTVSFGLFTAGLLSSTIHLGRPERAWRAISQWRTSWLSREGLASLLTYPPMLLFGLCWGLKGRPWPLSDAFGVLSALMAFATICSTAMIYASLKPIRQWHNPHVLPNYLLLAAFSGAACLAAVAIFWPAPASARLAAALAVVAGIIGLLGKLSYWRAIDSGRPIATIESATGLGWLGQVRMLESPNSEENYLLREMAFRIGRKHAAALRRIALAAGFVAPIVLVAVGAALAGLGGRVLLPLGAAVALVGLYVERWLFFAQATHTVTLYYGAPRA
jgi:DMSO reductase anchor subunit